MRDEANSQVANINELIDLFENQDNIEIVRKMRVIVPEFISNNSAFEQLDDSK
jgi:hypothetical protein